MSQLILSEGAVRGVERCRHFLQEKSAVAAVRAAGEIKRHLALLERSPESGRPLSDPVELRELIIPFGDSGYVALYRYDKEIDVVVVLAFRHQKEVGY